MLLRKMLSPRLGHRPRDGPVDFDEVDKVEHMVDHGALERPLGVFPVLISFNEDGRVFGGAFSSKWEHHLRVLTVPNGEDLLVLAEVADRAVAVETFADVIVVEVGHVNGVVGIEALDVALSEAEARVRELERWKDLTDVAEREQLS